jgi:hypothetical protein
MSKIEQLEKRIAELEAELAKLKAQPLAQQVIHSHYHYVQPAYVGVPAWTPHWPQVTFGGSGLIGGNDG